MKNLNKENLWNDLYERYPEAMKHFCNWIDEYKNEVNWASLFNEVEYKETGRPAFKTYAPKFHDLPIEFQNGIIARYELEMYNNKDGKGKEEYVKIMQAYRTQVIALFSDLNSQIQKRATKLS